MEVPNNILVMDIKLPNDSSALAKWDKEAQEYGGQVVNQAGLILCSRRIAHDREVHR